MLTTRSLSLGLCVSPRSVPGVEASPDFTNVHNGLTVPVVAAAACSLHYLHGRAEALAQVRVWGQVFGRLGRLVGLRGAGVGCCSCKGVGADVGLRSKAFLRGRQRAGSWAGRCRHPFMLGSGMNCPPHLPKPTSGRT